MSRRGTKRKNSSVFLFLKVFGGVLVFGLLLIFLIARRNHLEQTEIANAVSSEAEVAETSQRPVIEWETSQSEEQPIYNGKYGALLADENAMKEQRAVALPNLDATHVTLSFGGDVLLDDEYAIMKTYQNRGCDLTKCFSADLLEQMQQSDVFMINNEFPYTLRGTPLPNKMFTFRANPQDVQILKQMGVDVVSVANNHISDFGEESLLDTLETLEGAQMPYTGAGRNISEASKPVYFINNNIKIAIIASTQLERIASPDTRGATEYSGGTFRCMEPELLIETIKEAKANSDVVILYIHWGNENEEALHWSETSQAAGYVEAGADVIIGDHPHILQQIGYIEDTPIFYSVGNFWFSSKTQDTCLAQVTVSQNGVENARFIPCVSANCTTSIASGAERDRIMNHMREISTGVKIDEEGNISLDMP